MKYEFFVVNKVFLCFLFFATLLSNSLPGRIKREAELENVGKDCWYKCNKQQGPCDWCGSKGFCCTKKNGWKDTSKGCDSSFGGETRHECALQPDSSSSDKLPTFHHVQCDESDSSSEFSPDICIGINFTAGNTHNVVLYEKDGDDRIYKGYILETLDDVTLTGYWDGDFTDASSYFITLATELIPNVKRFRRNKDGSTSLVTFNKTIDNVISVSKNDSNFFMSDSDKSNINSLSEYPKLKKLPTSGWELDIFVFYDDTFFAKLNKNTNEAERFIKRVIDQTEPLFSHAFSFPTKMKLNLLGIEYAPGQSWNADDNIINGISIFSEFFKKYSRIYIFFCMPEKHDDIYGIIRKGKIGYLCDRDEKTRMAIVECNLDNINKETSAAVVLAHEIGHIFGIHHDKDIRKWHKQKHNCTGEGGIMDGIPELDEISDYKWTNCSQLDLIKFYNSKIRKRPFCLKKLPADESDINIEEGKQVRLPCVHRCPKDLQRGFKWFKQTSTERYRILTMFKRNKKINYNKQKIDRENILIDLNVSDSDLWIKKAYVSDQSDYICESKCRNPIYEETSIVSLHVVVDCVWSAFGEWSACSKPCGGGIKSRSRSVLTQASNGGEKCQGIDTMTATCNEKECLEEGCACTCSDEHDHCETFSKSDCSEAFVRKKCAKYCNVCPNICTEPEWCKLSANTKSCSFLPGIKITCERSCKPCKDSVIHCKWDDWKIQECDKTCGGGTRVISRTKKVNAKNGGADCTGPEIISESCITKECPADEIVITTGWSNYNYLNDTELVKIRSSGIMIHEKKCKVPDYPLTLDAAKGIFLSESNVNIICGGGNNRKKTATNKCHQFDSNSKSWNEVNPLKIARSRHAITSIGQSLVTCGGETASGQTLSSCEIMINGNGQWTTMKPLPTKLWGHCMVEKDPSTIVSLGGYDGSGSTNKMFEYSMSSNQWNETNTPMNQKRRGHECVKISEDEILVIGGTDGYGYFNSTEVYDKMYDNWSTGPTMPKPIEWGQFIKASPESQFLGYYLGGFGYGGWSSDIYGLSKDLSNFQLIGNLKEKRSNHVAFRLPESIGDKCGD